MEVYFHQDQNKYNPPGEFDGKTIKTYSEGLWRLELVINSLNESKSAFNFIQPDLISTKDIISIHSEDYVEFLSSIPKNTDNLAPIAFSFPNSKNKPKFNSSFNSKLGYYFFDPATPVNSDTFSSALASASVAINSISSLENTGRVICLTRPPGHHAMKGVGGGYCFFNNVALMAQKLVDKSKQVSILDIDFHHGNGTQEIFYNTDKVQYISIHGDPDQFYPFYWGSANEKGEGDGYGFNINYPLPKSTNNNKYDRILDKAIREISEYNPEYVLVSLGLDCYKHDIVGGMELSLEYYMRIGQKLSIFPKLAIVFEGGYHNDIGKCFLNVVKELF